MYLINRAAAIVKIKQPCLDWINSDSPVDLTLESVNEECNVYLLPEFDMPDEAQEIITDMYEDIFENELVGFCTDHGSWPEISEQMFKEWFSVEVHSMVFDPTKDKIKKVKFNG